MATEAQIRDAERARLEAIVGEFGTEGEQTQLLLSGVLRNGVTLGQYLGEEPLGQLAPDPEFLARLARRVERREKAGLPAVACAGEPPTHGCSCLLRALDEAGAEPSSPHGVVRISGSKRAILKRARAFHWSPPRRSERVPSEEVTPAPQEIAAGPQEATGRVEDPPPQPKPPPEPEPPFRVVKHFPRWYDPEPQSFRDMKF